MNVFILNHKNSIALKITCLFKSNRVLMFKAITCAEGHDSTKSLI